MSVCTHKHITRYDTGFYCNDCNLFFEKNSQTYRSTELLSTLWMILHNINAKRSQNGLCKIDEVTQMKEKIGLDKEKYASFEDYEVIISEAELIIEKYNIYNNTATMTMK